MRTHPGTRAVPGRVASSPARQLLYIGSDPFCAFVAKHLLESIGHDVTVFATPAEAFAARYSCPDDWDLVVMDIGMSGLSGLDVARTLRDRHPGLHYAVISDVRLDNATSEGLSTIHPRPERVEEFGALVELVETVPATASLGLKRLVATSGPQANV
jgi:CheY-like chemotaxis protein